MVDHKRITSNHRARAAKMFAGLATTQAVATLRITEEARGKAKATNMEA